MAQHMRNGGDADRAAKHAAALASSHASRRHSEHVASTQERGDFSPASGREDREASHARKESSGRQQYPRTFGEFVRRNIVYILSVAAVALIAVGMLVFLRTCAPEEAESPASSTADSSQEQIKALDWSNLVYDNGRYSYVVNGQVKSRTGIDVSENQHEIDWNAVASDGIDFAMIRLGYRGATEGDLYVDEYFQDNLDGAKAAGIPCGVYFFSQAKTVEEAVEEANFVLRQLDRVPLEYPIAFDSEEAVLGLEETRVSNLSKTEMTLVAKAFCSRVELGGYESVIYGNASDLSRMHEDSLKGRDLWWAEYDVSAPSTNTDIVMWQYSIDGAIAGIADAVDMNIDLTGAYE